MPRNSSRSSENGSNTSDSVVHTRKFASRSRSRSRSRTPGWLESPYARNRFPTHDEELDAKCGRFIDTVNTAMHPIRDAHRAAMAENVRAMHSLVDERSSLRREHETKRALERDFYRKNIDACLDIVRYFNDHPKCRVFFVGATWRQRMHNADADMSVGSWPSWAIDPEDKSIDNFRESELAATQVDDDAFKMFLEAGVEVRRVFTSQFEARKTRIAFGMVARLKKVVDVFGETPVVTRVVDYKYMGHVCNNPTPPGKEAEDGVGRPVCMCTMCRVDEEMVFVVDGVRVDKKKFLRAVMRRTNDDMQRHIEAEAKRTRGKSIRHYTVATAEVGEIVRKQPTVDNRPT